MARTSPAVVLTTAAVALAVPAAALAQTYYPLPPGPSPFVKKSPKKLSLTATPTRDTTKPYKYKATGTLTLPTGYPKSTCTGTITLTLKRGDTTVGRTTTKLNSSCKYSKTIAVKSTAKLAKKKGVTKGSLRLKARYGGNAVMRAKNSNTKVVFYGPKK